jgi:hypothetical protein
MYTSFAFGVLFLLFAAIPYIFQRPPYYFTISQAGLAFISVGVGVILGVTTCILVDRTFYQKQHRRAVAKGIPFVAPEHRLYSAMIGSSGIVIGLFWFGWCAGTEQHWAACLAGAIPFAWGNICLFVSCVSWYACLRADVVTRLLQRCTWSTCTVRRMAHQQWQPTECLGTRSALYFHCLQFRVSMVFLYTSLLSALLTFSQCTKLLASDGRRLSSVSWPCSCCPYHGCSSNGDQQLEEKANIRRWVDQLYLGVYLQGSSEPRS